MEKKKYLVFFTLFLLVLMTGPAYSIAPTHVLVNVGLTMFEIFCILGIGIAYAFQSSLMLVTNKKRKQSISRYQFLVVIILLAVSAYSLIILYKDLSRDQLYHLTRNLYKAPSDYLFIEEKTSENKEFAEIINEGRPERNPELGIDNLDLSDRYFDDDSVIIDIRSSREYQACTLRNAVNIPADILHNHILHYKDKEIVLIGNSDVLSSILAQAFHRRGYNILYVKGGIQFYAYRGLGFALADDDMKNMAQFSRFLLPEQREIIGLPPGKLSNEDFDKLNQYILSTSPNSSKLWMTEDVFFNLYLTEKAYMVDVRPRRDFFEPRVYHIPVGLIDYDRTQEMISRIPADKDVLVICDDMTSGFEAYWLGHELSRHGYNYIGRYPNPQNFYLRKPRLAIPYNFPKITNAVLAGLEYIQSAIQIVNTDYYGNPNIGFLSIILYIFFVRLALLPLSYLGHIHKLRTLRSLTIEKSRGSLPPQKGINKILYISNLVKESLVAKILKILPDLVTLSFAVLFCFFINEQTKILYPIVRNANEPSLYISILTALLAYVYETYNPVYFDFENRNKNGAYIYPVPLLFSVVLVLSGSVVIPAIFMVFLGANYALAIAEYNMIKFFNRKSLALPESIAQTGEVGGAGEPSFEKAPGLSLLQDLRSSDYAGAKAYNLGRMMKAGHPVPEGFVINMDFIKAIVSDEPDKDRLNALHEAWNDLKLKKAMVRSSAGEEDNPRHSYAGIFRSMDNVSEDTLEKAIKKVYSSYQSERLKVYHSHAHLKDREDISGGIIIQRMIDADCWGVIFTVNPADPANMSIDVYEGGTENNAMETKTPRQVFIGRKSGQILNPKLPEGILETGDIQKLAESGFRIEKEFLNPQDIEWAFADGKFYILQSRNIVFTESISDRDIIEEKQRLLDKVKDEQYFKDKTVWVFNEVSEVLPMPACSSLSLFRMIWAPEGPIDAAYFSLGLPYNRFINPDDILETVFSKLYVNRIEESKLMLSRNGIVEKAVAAYGKLRIEMVRGNYYKNHRLGFFTYLPNLSRRIKDADEKDSLFDLLDEILSKFLTGHLVEAFRINIILDYCFMWLQKDLEAAGIDINELYPAGAGGLSSGVFQVDGIYTLASNSDEFITKFGHRAVVDYELSCPRLAEDPLFAESLFATQSQYDVNKREKPAEKKIIERLEKAESSQNHSIPPGIKKRINKNMELVSEYVSLKEQARDITIRHITILRSVLLKIAQLYGIGEDIFQLTLDEIRNLRNGKISWQDYEKIWDRKKLREKFGEINLPVEIRVMDLEKMGIEGEGRDRDQAPGVTALKGLRVSRSDKLEGFALVLKNPETVSDLNKDVILVTAHASPAWSIYLPYVRGIITESGGMLSHLAILAREYGVPYIARCPGALNSISSGDSLVMNPDGSVVIKKQG